MAVLLKNRFDVAEYGRQFERGLVPDWTPYGFHHAADRCTISYSRPTPPSLLQRLVAKILGFDLLHAWRNRDVITGNQIVWTMTESEYLAAILVCKLLRTKQPKIIAQSIWLFDRWHSLSGPKRSFLRMLLKAASVFTIHSKEYKPQIQAILPDADVRLHLFGISLDTFPLSPPRFPRAEGPIRIFAAGTDKTRDWPTLLQAFAEDDRFELVVVTGSLSQGVVKDYRNVQLPREPSMQEFRDYYRWADFVVVPMQPNLYSGITVALEATAMGAAVISSETGGVPTYFDSHEVRYVPPGDAEGLKDAALSISDSERVAMVERAQARFTRDGYSTKDLADRYVALSDELMTRDDAVVSRKGEPVAGG